MVGEKKTQLEKLDERGWILGPKEKQTAYLDRIQALEHFFSHPPETIDHFLTDRDWEPTRQKVQTLYDVAPDWIVAHFSNKQLTFFQGAATWIIEKDTLRIPLIQLKEKFETETLYKLYHKSEVLAHETVHAVRMQFDEPKFEEIFAYQTSSKWWHRTFGPLFEKPSEPHLFIGLLFLPLLTQILEILDWKTPIFAYAPLIPLGFFTYLLTRLLFYRLALSCALKKIKKGLKDPKKKWATALRLTDREILQFAFSSKEKIQALIKEDKTPRWNLLRQKYFKNKIDWL